MCTPFLRAELSPSEKPLFPPACLWRILIALTTTKCAFHDRYWYFTNHHPALNLVKLAKLRNGLLHWPLNKKIKTTTLIIFYFQYMRSTCAFGSGLKSPRCLRAFAKAGFNAKVFFNQVAACTSMVLICGTNVRMFLTGSQSANPWPQTRVFSSMTPLTHASRRTGREHGPRGVLNRSLQKII